MTRPFPLTPEQRTAVLSGNGFVVNRIRRVPCASSPFVVTIDGRDYAGFVDEASMRAAAELWREFWPAARGRKVDVSVRH